MKLLARNTTGKTERTPSAWKSVIRVRRAGTAYIVVSVTLGVVAVNSGNNLLYLSTAVLLGYMLASGVVGRRNVRNAEASFAFPDEIYAGFPCPVSVRLRNKSRFFSLLLVDVSLFGERALFASVPPQRVETRILFVNFPQRGAVRVTGDDVELFSAWPFNFFVRWWPVALQEAVTVFPHPLPCDPVTVFARETRNPAEDAALPAGDTDVAGVRGYIEGDAMKRIHWKSSARTGKLRTRVYDGGSSLRGGVIDLDPLVAEDVEGGLSKAAWTVTESMKSGLPVGLHSRGRIIPPESGRGHGLFLLRELACYDVGRAG